MIVRVAGKRSDPRALVTSDSVPHDARFSLTRSAVNPVASSHIIGLDVQLIKRTLILGGDYLLFSCSAA
jgi:hypothetical protein